MSQVVTLGRDPEHVHDDEPLAELAGREKRPVLDQVADRPGTLELDDDGGGRGLDAEVPVLEELVRVRRPAWYSEAVLPSLTTVDPDARDLCQLSAQLSYRQCLVGHAGRATGLHLTKRR